VAQIPVEDGIFVAVWMQVPFEGVRYPDVLAVRSLLVGGILADTTVRLNVEENQLVKVFGEFCVCIGSLKSA
jgi:hypothetical protein